MKIKILTWDPKKKIMYGPFAFSHFPARLKRDCFIQLLYTGIKDCNGAEVYDGCILTDGKYVAVCKYEAGHFYLDDGKIYNVCLDVSIENGFCVIGNIHEHGKLLKDA